MHVPERKADIVVMVRVHLQRGYLYSQIGATPFCSNVQPPICGQSVEEVIPGATVGIAPYRPEDVLATKRT